MKNKKITVIVPEDLILRAQRNCQAGVTETVRKGLEVLAAADAYRRLRDLRGKAKFSVDFAELRNDKK